MQQEIGHIAALFLWCPFEVKEFCSPLAPGHCRARWLSEVHADPGPSACHLPLSLSRICRAGALGLQRLDGSLSSCPSQIEVPTVAPRSTGQGAHIRQGKRCCEVALPYPTGNMLGTAQGIRTKQRRCSIAPRASLLHREGNGDCYSGEGRAGCCCLS